MTYKSRRFVLMTTVLGVAFNFLPASPRAATLDQIESPRVMEQGAPRYVAHEEIQAPRARVYSNSSDTERPRAMQAAPDDLQSPRGRAGASPHDTQAPRGAQARQDEFQAPRGEANATPDDTEKP